MHVGMQSMPVNVSYSAIGNCFIHGEEQASGYANTTGIHNTIRRPSERCRAQLKAKDYPSSRAITRFRSKILTNLYDCAGLLSYWCLASYKIPLGTLWEVLRRMYKP